MSFETRRWFRHYVLLAGDRWLCVSRCACGEAPAPTTGTHPDTSGMAPVEQRRAAA